MGTRAGKRIDDFRVATALTIARSGHGHGREKWDALSVATVEALREQHRLSGDGAQFVFRNIDTCITSHGQGDSLPGLDAVVIGLLRELGDGEPSVPVDDRGLRARSAQRGAGREDHLQILVGFFVTQYPFGDLHEAAKLYHRRHSSFVWRLILSLPGPAEPQRPEPGFIRYTEKIVGFKEGANLTPLALGGPAFGSLHELAAPGVRGRVADRTEDWLISRGREAAASQRQSRFEGEGRWIA